MPGGFFPAAIRYASGFMNRRTFLQTAAGGWLATGGSTGQAAALKPNIIIILADDLGFSDIGCYGSEIATPNLDALARRGVRFTQFSNNARCCPTRAALLTGVYSHQAGIGHMTEDHAAPGYRGDLNRNCLTIAEALRPAGYRTLMAGKWHVTWDQPDHSTDKHNWPLQRGFDEYYGTITGAGSYYDPVMLTEGNQPVQADHGSFYYTDAIGDRAVSYIDRHAGKQQPFFLYAAFTAPHWPLHALPEDIDKYKDRYKMGWDALRQERHRRQVEMGIVDKRWPLTARDKDVPAWSAAPNKEWQARRMAVYAAQVDRLDQNTGKMLRKLKEKGIEENTLVLFLADNGGCAEEIGPRWNQQFIPKATRDGRPYQRGNDPRVMPGEEGTYQSYGLPWANASNTPFRLYKHWIHEGGISTPLIASWPKVIRKQGGLTRQRGHIMDLMATCVDIGGAAYPSEREGNPVHELAGTSLRPVLQGRTRRQPVVFWEHEGNRAVRQEKWKLVSRYPGGWELYDLESDRTEQTDLSAKHAGRVREMAALWERWAARVGVKPWKEIQRPPA